MCKKIIFILSVFILIFSFSYNSFASGNVVSGLTWNVPESPDFPNHTYIFIYEHVANNPNDGIYMIKYYMPIVLLDKSSSTYYRLRMELVNALYYKYNPSTDTFEPQLGSQPKNVGFYGNYVDSNGNDVPWDDPTAVTGIFPLASNHNIYVDDGTLFFWTIQQNTNSPHLYRPQVEAMMKTLLVVGGRTLGVLLVIFGIVLGILWAKRLIFLFLH